MDCMVKCLDLYRSLKEFYTTPIYKLNNLKIDNHLIVILIYI